MRNFLIKSLAVTSLLATIIVGSGLVYIQASGSKLLSVQSGSMVPAIKKGDLVTVTSVSNGKFAVGDVITFTNPVNKQQTITHRVIQTPTLENGSKIITKGDANPSADTPITKESVIGKVNYNVPVAGYGIDFIRKPVGLILLIYIPALVVIISELRRLSAYYKSVQGYRLFGHRIRTKVSGNKKKILAGVKVTVFLAILTLPFAQIAHAALMSSATFTSNTINTALAPTPASGILLRRVEFHCSDDNTATANYLPEIFIYNTTRTDKPVGNWYMKSSAGVVATFRPQTVFDSRDNYDIEPDLRNGLSYSGDYLALFDSQNNLIDAISWGTDQTYLNPSLVSPVVGTVFRRVQLVTDTDTAADWAVSVESCN